MTQSKAFTDVTEIVSMGEPSSSASHPDDLFAALDVLVIVTRSSFSGSPCKYLSCRSKCLCKLVLGPYNGMVLRGSNSYGCNSLIPFVRFFLKLYNSSSRANDSCDLDCHVLPVPAPRKYKTIISSGSVVPLLVAGISKCGRTKEVCILV